MKLIPILAFILILSACDSPTSEARKFQTDPFPVSMIAHHFQLPVGEPPGRGYYNAQSFGKNYHLGDDWNALTGGNSDLGDPIYGIANGKVTFAEDIGGDWGNVVRIVHQLPDGTKVESLYAHCDKISVKQGQWIKKGALLGTIGNAGGKYYAHLHLEIRSVPGMPIGPGYSADQTGYLDPTKFIREHR